MSKPRVAEAAQGEVVEAVNFNAPGQVVIAGTAPAVARAIETATAKGARRAMTLPISVPAHSSLMQPAAEQLRVRLEGAPVAAGRGHHGVRRRREGPCRTRPTFAPVWSSSCTRRCIGRRPCARMIAAGATHIVECGPGKVLTSLNRRIDKNRDLKMLALEDPQSFDEALALSVS